MERGDIEAQREARCDIVAILRFPIMGGKQDEALADVEIPNVAGSRFEMMMIVLLLFLQKQNLANAIYLFGLGTLLSGLGLKHMRIHSHHDLAGTLVTPYSWEDHGGVLRLLPVYPSQCSLLQVTSTDVAFPPFCRS